MNNINKFDDSLRKLYQLIGTSGYTDEDIEEINKCFEILNSFKQEIKDVHLIVLVKESQITSLNDEIDVLKSRIEILECGVKSKYVNNENLHNEINRLSIENIHLKRKIAEMELMKNA